MIKYSIAQKNFKLNLKWNSNKRQNRETIENLLKLIFWRFLPNFDKKFWNGELTGNAPYRSSTSPIGDGSNYVSPNS
jgi:hypothetical protein